MNFMPQHAPIVALAFLGTALAGGAGVLLLVGLWLAGRPQSAVRVMAGVIGLGVVYGFTLLGAAYGSPERTLQAGEWKYFCELDCHFAVTMDGASVVDALGSGDARVSAAGRFHVVAVRAWFDGSTVSSRRPAGAPLYTSPRRVVLRDGSGRTWRPSEAGQRALGEAAEALDRKLVPGESYVARYVFDVPRGATGLRLVVEDRSLVSRFLIGHENSPFHGKTAFDVSAAEQPGGRASRASIGGPAGR